MFTFPFHFFQNHVATNKVLSTQFIAVSVSWIAAPYYNRYYIYLYVNKEGDLGKLDAT